MAERKAKARGRGRKTGSRRRLLLPPLLGVAVGLGILVADQERGLVVLLESRDQTAQLRAEVADLESTRDRLADRVRRLESDDFEIESAARKLGMVRPGEVVVRLER